VVVRSNFAVVVGFVATVVDEEMAQWTLATAQSKSQNLKNLFTMVYSFII
jgi:hypothetical protein